MKHESGRSLIEVIGVISITAVMTVAAIGAYNVMRTNQKRTIANAELQQIAQDTKILLEMRGTYEGISVEYLVKAGALESEHAPIGGDGWSVDASVDGESFSINLVDLTSDECEFFSQTKPKWANAVLINGFETGYTDNCFETNTNQISFVVE